MGWLREQNFSMSIFKAKAADSLHQNKQTKNKLMLIIYVSKPKSPYHLLGLVQYSAQSSTHLTVRPHCNEPRRELGHKADIRLLFTE